MFGRTAWRLSSRARVSGMFFEAHAGACPHCRSFTARAASTGGGASPIAGLGPHGLPVADSFTISSGDVMVQGRYDGWQVLKIFKMWLLARVKSAGAISVARIIHIGKSNLVTKTIAVNPERWAARNRLKRMLRDGTQILVFLDQYARATARFGTIAKSGCFGLMIPRPTQRTLPKVVNMLGLARQRSLSDAPNEARRRTPRPISVCDGRDNNYNLIRILAALAVLVSHAWPLTLGPEAVQPLATLTGIELGTQAVYVFFAISGFLIARSFVRHRTLKDWIAG